MLVCIFLIRKIQLNHIKQSYISDMEEFLKENKNISLTFQEVSQENIYVNVTIF